MLFAATVVAAGVTTAVELFNVYQSSPDETGFALVARPFITGALGVGSGEWAWKVAALLASVEGPMSDPVTLTV